MIYDMNKPSANMLLNNTELNRMHHEQQVELYNKEQNKILAEQSAVEREKEEYFNNLVQYQIEQSNNAANRSERLLKIKEAFVSECLYKLYCECVGFPMTSRDKIIGKNLINKFVIENGAGNLISSFATKNMILSEFSRICDKYYSMVVESLDCKNEDGCYNIGCQTIDQKIADEFYKELEEVDVADASKLIKDRVADAISDFIDTNSANKLEYEEIIKQAQDKIASINGDEALAESYINMAKRRINDMRFTQDKNVFGCMVESLTTSVFKDDGLRERYVHEGSVDMDGIVNSTQLIYTMLEMVNTTNMVNVDEEFINRYLTNL